MSKPRTRFPVAGHKIADLRDERGWNATRFAEKVGISVAFMRRIELGHRQPSPAVRKRITDVLEVPMQAILADDTPVNAA